MEIQGWQYHYDAKQELYTAKARNLGPQLLEPGMRSGLLALGNALLVILMASSSRSLGLHQLIPNREMLDLEVLQPAVNVGEDLLHILPGQGSEHRI